MRCIARGPAQQMPSRGSATGPINWQRQDLAGQDQRRGKRATYQWAPAGPAAAGGGSAYVVGLGVGGRGGSKGVRVGFGGMGTWYGTGERRSGKGKASEERIEAARRWTEKIVKSSAVQEVYSSRLQCVVVVVVVSLSQYQGNIRQTALSAPPTPHEVPCDGRTGQTASGYPRKEA